MWSHQLFENLNADKSPIEVIILHPGTVFSEGSIAALKTLPLSSLIIALVKPFFLSPSKSAYLTAFAAGSPLIREQPDKYHGAYLKPKMILANPSALALNKEKQIELSNFTEMFLVELGVW